MSNFWENMIYNSRDILGGTIHGIVQILLGQPFDTIKVRMQAAIKNESSMWQLKSLIKNEGIFALYKGTTSPLAANAFIVSVQFGVFENMKKLFRVFSGQEHLPIYYSMLSAVVSGSILTLIVTPMELVRIRQQMKTKRGFDSTLRCFFDICKNEGIKGLYRGIVTTAQREVIGEIVYFSTYDGLMRFFQNTYPNNKNVQQYAPILCGSAAGVAFWVGMYPVDTLKSKMQADSATNPQYSGTMDCFKKTMELDGIRAFYRGVGVTAARGAITNAGGFYAFEQTRKYIENLYKKY